MAESGKFSQNIVECDEFYELPLASQALYFHLGMQAHGRGLLYNLYATADMLGVSKEETDVLLDRGYLMPHYEDGEQYGYEIVHWDENNLIGENAKKRLTYSYRKWRESVFQRDGYRCQICGCREDLEAHHIKPFADYPNERLEIDNGVTLCRTCHRRVHKEKDSEWLYLRE